MQDWGSNCAAESFNLSFERRPRTSTLNNNYKLITTKACDHVLRAQRSTRAHRYLLENNVTRFMPIPVIDELKAVHVKKDD